MHNFIKTWALPAFVIFCGCKNSSTNPGFTGNMVGYAYAVDTLGGIDSSGITVSVDGANRSTISSVSGKWELDNMLPGTYNISFSKDGYAMEKVIAYRFVGNGTDFLNSAMIYQIAKRNASLVLRAFEDYQNIFYKDTVVTDSLGEHSVYILDTTVIPLGISILSCRIFRNSSAESLQGNSIILFGKSEHLDPMDPGSYLYSSDNALYISGGGSPDANGYSFSIFRNDLLAAGFRSGDKIFCEASASNIQSWTYNFKNNQILIPSYYDIGSNKQIYTCFGNNRSDVKSFILP